MKALVSAFVCGAIFSLGLLISGMTEPTKVLGFLDVFGDWDPSLAFTMAAALAVTMPGYVWARRHRPVLAPAAEWPTATDIDVRLVGGAALFGIGWGLVGLCPGPAIVDLASLSPKLIGFILAMAVGAFGHRLWRARRLTLITAEA